jgi:hypothetical protein
VELSVTGKVFPGRIQEIIIAGLDFFLKRS